MLKMVGGGVFETQCSLHSLYKMLKGLTKLKCV